MTQRSQHLLRLWSKWSEGIRVYKQLVFYLHLLLGLGAHGIQDWRQNINRLVFAEFWNRNDIYNGSYKCWWWKI